MERDELLCEIVNPRQIPGEPRRRWFHSAEMDLIVWMDVEGKPAAFQLCYDKQRREKALTWRPGQGHAHMNVDDGETAAGRHKASPILIPDGDWDGARLDNRFTVLAKDLPEEIVCFVRDRL